MSKMKFESPDLTAQNIDRIAALFPNCVTEMLDEERSTKEKKVYKRAINFELLKQMLSPDVVDGDEAYEFTWVGKKAAIVETNKPIRKTLRPCVEESKNWDSTENLYIEGDNLEVLKLLQESYLGKVKMIYIDPPYNTGNDFIYADDFMRSQEEENEQMGMFDEDENRLFKNTDTNGRFHSDWCSMIYSRLMLARNLLTEDGVIFISIDDNEVENLKKICDEVFGTENFLSQISVVTGANQSGEGVLIQKNVEYCILYAKSITNTRLYRIDKTDESYRNLNDAPTAFETRLDMGYTIYYNQITGEMIPMYDYDKNKVYTNDEKQVYIDDSKLIQKGFIPIRPGKRNGKLHRWRWGMDTFLERKSEIKVFKVGDKYVPKFLQSGFNAPKNIWNYTVGTVELKKIFNAAVFDYSKSVKLLEYIISISTDNNSIILDFFSGSATTAHAVMQLNAEDGGHRKFIMVQLPEKCDETSEAYKAGYKNICEIGKERIRRAGEKIKAESPMTTQDLDIGFRVLKLDDTNMKDVYYAADDYSQDMIAGLESNIKDDRTDLDLLFGCLIDWGLPLSLPYRSEQMDGCTVHTYNGGDLIACFDANIPESVVKTIAKRKPLRAVFRDSGFASSPEKINVFEIFKFYMPEDAGDITKRVRVI